MFWNLAKIKLIYLYNAFWTIAMKYLQGCVWHFFVSHSFSYIIYLLFISLVFSRIKRQIQWKSGIKICTHFVHHKKTNLHSRINNWKDPKSISKIEIVAPLEPNDDNSVNRTCILHPLKNLSLPYWRQTGNKRHLKM